jgi:hypothetical protein
MAARGVYKTSYISDAKKMCLDFIKEYLLNACMK